MNFCLPLALVILGTVSELLARSPVPMRSVTVQSGSLYEAQLIENVSPPDPIVVRALKP